MPGIDGPGNQCSVPQVVALECQGIYGTEHWDGSGRMIDLGPVFEPKRVAVVGVSLSNPFHPANIIYNKNYYGFEAEMFAVNPRGGTLERRPDKPVVAYVPNLAKYGMVLEGFELNGIPVVHSIEHAVQMLKSLRLLGEHACPV